jgi:hypothetical protein
MKPDLMEHPLPSFDDMIGYQQEKAKLLEMIAAKELPEVLLFVGRRGIGKRKLMAFLCTALSCDNKTACCDCASCRQVAQGTNPELLWFEGKQSLTVKDAAEFRDHLNWQAQSGTRVGVICDVDRMTHSAANSLLKVLEEPPADSLQILSTSKIKTLLPTIKSRAFKWYLKPPAVGESLAFLKQLWEASGLEFDEQGMLMALKKNGYGLGPVVDSISKEKRGFDQEIGKAISFALKGETSYQPVIEIAKKHKVSVDQFLDHYEIGLNDFYGQQQFFDFKHLLNRYKIHQIKHHRQTPLNTQLVIESLFLER